MLRMHSTVAHALPSPMSGEGGTAGIAAKLPVQEEAEEATAPPLGT